MADTWTKTYIKARGQKEQQQQDDQKRADLAEAGAADAFRRIREQVRQDLAAFHKALMFSHVTLAGDATPSQFSLIVYSSPSAELHVELSGVIIKYMYSSLPKGNLEEKSGTLRISSDLDGVTQIHRSGDSFADESEVSEFFLKPLLDYIDAQ
jgi:hypothetical protein